MQNAALQAVSTFDLERTSTPVRLPTRNETPIRAGSNSRGGGGGSAMRKRMLLSADKPDREAAEKTAGRSMSHRKQRRWENKNLMGSEQLNQLLCKTEEEAEFELRKRDGLGEHAFLCIEWRSAFHKLFESQNRDALEIFRQCAEQFTKQHPSTQRTYASQAEEAWFKVGKRLRSVVLACLAENPAKLFPFLGLLEDHLVHFAVHHGIKSQETDDKALSSYLQSPLFLDNTGVLHVFLSDFKGNRFLLHAVCQFYNLQSKSYKKKGSNSKVTAVAAPKRPSATAAQRISITNFLLSEYFQKSRGAEEWQVRSESPCSEMDHLGGVLEDVL